MAAPRILSTAARRLIPLVAFGLLCAFVTPAEADSQGEPHVVRTIPFYWSGPVTTNTLTQTTYVGDINLSRLMVLDDRTGSYRVKGLDGCQCLGEMVSDDRTGNLFIAPGGEESGLYMLDEKTLRLREISQDGIWSLAVDQTRDIVYAGDAFSPVIHVIDGRSGRYLRTIHVGYAAELSVDPAMNRLYAATQTMGDAGVREAVSSTFDVVVVDVGSGRVVAHLPEANGPIAVDPAGGLVYGPTPDHRLAVFDARTEKLVRSTPLPSRLGEWSLVFDPANGRLYIAAGGPAGCLWPHCKGYVLVVDASRGSLIDTIHVGAEGIGVSVDPRADLVFAASEYHVTVISG